MYNVKQLIEALKQCPEEYTIAVIVEGLAYGVEAVGIDAEDGTVDLFAE